MAEGDAVAAATYSGHAVKNAVLGFGLDAAQALLGVFTLLGRAQCSSVVLTFLP